MLMPSFNNLNGRPSTVNEYLMKDVLRGELGYDGLVISDYNAIGELLLHGVAEDLKDAAYQAFKCGCHIEMMPPAYHKHLKELVEEGRIAESELDEYVLKFLEFKDELGLFDDPYHGADPEKQKEICLCQAHRELSLRAARNADAVIICVGEPQNNSEECWRESGQGGSSALSA
jgi:beta-glucosidase